MRRDYEVFERFPDGSTLYRACVTGRFEAQRKLHEFREHSENEFFILDVVKPHRFIPTNFDKPLKKFAQSLNFTDASPGRFSAS